MRLTRLSIIVLLLSISSLAQMRGFHGGARGFGGRPVVVAPHHGVRFVGGFPNSPFFNNGPFFHGVPASVTSLGPCGFTPCFHPFFRHGFRHFGFSPFFGGGFVSSFPVAVPVAVDSDYATQAQPVVQQPALPQRLEITIVDQRGEKQNGSESAEPARANPKHSDDPDRPNTPAIFVFKDGSRKELANYAIMHGQLMDVTDGKIFRIPLEKIDREKTLAANAKAGREIQLP
jgi:hypothetical protein